jgi:hypothetical protein
MTQVLSVLGEKDGRLNRVRVFLVYLEQFLRILSFFFFASIKKSISRQEHYTISKYRIRQTFYSELVFLFFKNITIKSGICMLFIRVLAKDWIQIRIQDSQKNMFRRAGYDFGGLDL